MDREIAQAGDAIIDRCIQRIVEASRELMREAEEDTEVSAKKRIAGMGHDEGVEGGGRGTSSTGATSSQGNVGPSTCNTSGQEGRRGRKALAGSRRARARRTDTQKQPEKHKAKETVARDGIKRRRRRWCR